MSSGGRPGGAEFIGATLLFSLLLHGVLILGIGFRYAKPHPSMPTLDVTLVDVANREAPRQADVLAQANNRGGGDRAEAARPSQRYAGELPRPSEDTAPQTATAAAPAPRPPTEQRLLTSIADSRFDVASATGRPPQEVTADADEARRQQAMAQLAAELRERNQAYAKRPKKKFISANTKEFAYAAYMRGWVDRVEQVGNLNYPDEARRRELAWPTGTDRGNQPRRQHQPGRGDQELRPAGIGSSRGAHRATGGALSTIASGPFPGRPALYHANLAIPAGKVLRDQ